MSRRDEKVTVEVICSGETDKALLVRLVDAEKSEAAWVPKSLITDTDVNGAGDSGEIEIPRWIAIDKGLVEEDD